VGLLGSRAATCCEPSYGTGVEGVMLFSESTLVRISEVQIPVSLSHRQLLCHAVHGTESPDQITGIDGNNFAGRKEFGQCI